MADITVQVDQVLPITNDRRVKRYSYDSLDLDDGSPVQEGLVLDGGGELCLSDDVADLEDECSIKEMQISRMGEEIRRLRSAIREFCKKSDWAVPAWKSQPYIATLYNIDSEVSE